MNRTGLAIALAVGAAVGLLFAIYPQLDVRIAALFYDPRVSAWSGNLGLMRTLRDLAIWTVVLIVTPAILAFVGKLIWPRRPMLIPGRAALLMLFTLALAPGLLANVLLKDQWGRPRPNDIVEFGGIRHFLPWWDPRGGCPKNCSFIAGEPAGAFWALAPAALTPPHLRALAYAAALAFGIATGVVRMAGGGHFFTDVVFSGVLTYLVIWLVYGLLYRWRLLRIITDAAIERLIEWLRGVRDPRLDTRRRETQGLDTQGGRPRESGDP